MLRKNETPRRALFIVAMGFLSSMQSPLHAEDAPALSTASAVAASSMVPAAVAVSTPVPIVAHTPVAKAAETAEFIGAQACLSCHDKRADFKDSIHGHAFQQLKGISFEQSCETCHGPGSLHAAAGGDKSNPGYAMIKSFKTMTAVELNKTCLECHEDEGRMHWMGSVHEKRNVSCLACHSIHEPKDQKSLLIQPRVELVCAQCHKDIVAKTRRDAHMPVEEGKMDCTSCHNPHGSSTPKMLKLASVNDTCYSCHADKRGPFVWEHPPVREDCLNCHDPHGSHNENMLNARLPFLCQRCHISSRHPAIPYDFNVEKAGNNRIMAEGCTNCHSNIHGSNHPSGKYFFR